MAKFLEPSISTGGFPSETWLQTCPQEVRNELHAFYSWLQGYFSTDHNADGTHNRVRAVSLTTDEGVQEFGRPQTLGVAEDIQWAPSLFSASAGMTWPVTALQKTTYRAALVGNLIFVTVAISSFNVGGVANTSLLLKLPWNLCGIGYSACLGFATDAGAAQNIVQVVLTDKNPYLDISDVAGGNWTITAGNNSGLVFSGWFPVQPNPLV